MKILPGSIGSMWKRYLGRNRGIAMIFTMMSIVVIAAALGLIVIRMQEAKKDTDNAVDLVQLDEAAQAGIDVAMKKLWNDYISTNGNTTMNWASYRSYLDTTLAIPKNEDLNFNGTQDANETGDGRNGFEKLPSGYDHRGWAVPGFPQTLKDPNTARVLATINSVHVARYDDPWDAYLTIRSNATVNGKSKDAVQVVEIGSHDANHTAFAILANNVNCILCHAEFLQVNLELNTNSANYNTFDRIKIAALQSLLVRVADTAGNVSGTLYSRGSVYKDSPAGQAYTASELAATTLKAYKISTTNGKIIQSGTGGKTQVSVANATTNTSGDLNPFSNLYLNYPTALDQQTDGTVPNSFPAPYPDDNNNRTVDDSEFTVSEATSNGTVGFQYGPAAPGSIKAGVAYGLPAGTAFTGTALPTTSNSALTDLNTGNYPAYDKTTGGTPPAGNLFLLGTSQDPIVINNTVAVNGDLVIAGPVKGSGLLNVRGNVYVVGDVTYADGAGTFGKAADGTENALAIQAGGNIMMGDYLTVRGVNHSSQNSAKYPDWTQYSINMRTANVTNSVTVSGKTESLPWGYNDTWSSDQGQVTTNKPGQQVSFTQAELMLFNRNELNKAIADSTYVPRFYGLRESQPSNAYVYMSTTDEHTVKYDESSVYTVASYIAAKGLSSLNILGRAKYQYLNPKGNWLSESTLRNIWWNDEQTRPSSFRDFKFDGLLYSNNAIFTIVRSNTRHKSNTGGHMTIRGGIIAQDLGMFVPGQGSDTGLNMLYDPRVERFLTPHDTNVVAVKRQAFYFENAAAG